ncbi:MAG: zinc metallopeptidase, partial [Cryomorphaceae bacterium]|nr:zinc metallopeptidase [Cryomorphaceae bacterium]
MIFIILLLFMVAGFAVQARLKNRFKKYSESYLSSGLSGAEVARRMLNFYGLDSVQIISVPGQLTDHYNPANKTVNLSPEVYEGRNISAAAVAAHECGHAVQHATAYAWLTMRSKMVPVVSFSGKIMNMVFLFSILGMSVLGLGFEQALVVVIAAQAVVATFAIVTLPVEYDASRRALVWLQGAGITDASNHHQAEDALKWAARTYLVAAAAAVTQLLYYIMLYMGRRD